MVKRLNCILFGISLWLLYFNHSSLQAQPWQLKDSTAFTLPASIVSNTHNWFYVATAEGAIIQCTPQGDTLGTYQPTHGEPPVLLPWQTLRLQAYFPFQQLLTMLDQNLNEVSTISLPEATIGNAAFSADQQVWYISTDLILNKYDPQLAEKALSTSLQWYLSEEDQVRLLQEYQNRLYIQTDKTLLIFDLFGNFLSKRPLSTNYPIQFFADEAYFLSGEDIHFIHLYSTATRRLTVPAGKNILKILMEKEYLHGYSERFWYTYLIID